MSAVWTADSTQIDASGALAGGIGQWTADGLLPAAFPTAGSFDYTTLVTSEHNQQPNFMALVNALANTFGSIRDFADALPAQFDLDSAVGAQLNVVGAWVGQPRVVPNVITVGFFGFQDTYGAAGFGELTNTSVGGPFWDLGTPYSGSVTLTDSQYRQIIRAKIASNQSQGTAATLVQTIEDVFGATASIQDVGNLTINLTISTPMSPLDQALITQFNLLPIPAGVVLGSINYIQVPLMGAAADASSGTGALSTSIKLAGSAQSTSTGSGTPTGPW